MLAIHHRKPDNEKQLDMEVDAMGEAADNPAEAVPYNFAQPLKAEMKLGYGLDPLQADFAAALAQSLSQHIGLRIDITPHTIESFRYDDFIATLSRPTCLGVLRIDPPNAQACLDISPVILFAMINLLLGGNRSAANAVPNRALTQTEQGLALQIVERAAGQLADKLSGPTPVAVREEDLASDPAQIRLMPADEVLTVMRFEATIGDSHGVIRLGLPAPVVEMIQSPATGIASPPPSETNRPTASKNLMQSAVELRAILAQTKLRLDEVLALQQGDLITTDVPVNAPIPLNMDKQSLRFGRLGELNGRRAFELIDRPPIDDGGERPS